MPPLSKKSYSRSINIFPFLKVYAPMDPPVVHFRKTVQQNSKHDPEISNNEREEMRMRMKILIFQ